MLLPQASLYHFENHVYRETDPYNFINRKSGISKEEFYSYWTQVHGPLVHDFMKRHGVVEYVQGRTISQKNHSYFSISSLFGGLAS